METQLTISRWVVDTFGDTGSNASIAARGNIEMAELVQKLAIDDNDPAAVEEAADVVIVLMRLAERMGGDLLAEVDRKMQINRARRWTIKNGHGQHVATSSQESTK